MSDKIEFTPEQLDENDGVRQIGQTKKGIKVFMLKTKGGFNAVVTSLGKLGVEILGVGSHPAIAKHLATMKNPDIELELTKSEDSDVRQFANELPYWSAETARWNANYN